MDVIGRIRELTQARGWSEYQLRKETGLAASTIANIFHRGSIPGVVTLEALCDAFGISLCQFFAEGDFIALTEEQKSLLDKWAVLSKEQKQIVLELISKMNQK